MIQGYATEAFDLFIDARKLTLLKVKNLERYVDREALLRDDTEEPPYWAHVWTGALTLARYIEERVECAELTVLDLGCGLGVTGIVAALKGGYVTFADKEPAALAFATVNAQLNCCPSFTATIMDFTADKSEQLFSLILGAEILYDRPTFPALASFLARHLALRGVALLADARRTNTGEFYHQLDLAGWQWTREEVCEREDNLPLPVGIISVRRSSDGHESHD
jgi:predicted nicotinamide N-methyase